MAFLSTQRHIGAEAMAELDIQSLSLRARSEGRLSKHQRTIEGATALIGRPRTIYVFIATVAAWVTLNSILFSSGSAHVIDPPPFFWLQGAIGFCALVVTTLVLTTQSRQARHAEERASLDLEVNLCTELKISKLIALVEELRQDMPSVRNRVDLQADAMQKALDPHAILNALEITKDGIDDSQG